MKRTKGFISHDFTSSAPFVNESMRRLFVGLGTNTNASTNTNTTTWMHLQYRPKCEKCEALLLAACG